MQNADRATTYGLFHKLYTRTYTYLLFNIRYAVLRKMFTTDTDVINLAVMYSTIVFSFSTIVNVGIAFEKDFPSSRQNERINDKYDMRLCHKHYS